MANDLAQTPAPATTREPAATPAASGGTGSIQLKAAVRATEGYDAQAALLAPVQQHGGKGDTSGVHAAAAHGLSGSGGALPHGGQIQQAFGGYDISNVTAHTDAAASQGAAAMGADAYATGSSIAFKGAPDLHTAAHEAAHVVQQDAGVSLSGGVGKAGDSYEQHADKVADAVVAGKSAEPILSEMAGGAGGGAVQKKAVQRVETTTPAPTTTPTPHGDAALAQVGAGTTPEATTTPETEAAAPVITVPQAYDTYTAHIRTTFAAELAQLRQMQEAFKQKSHEGEISFGKLVVNDVEMQVLRTRLADKKMGLATEEEKAQRIKDEKRLDNLESMKQHDGKTMEQLHEEATALVKEADGKQYVIDDDVAAMEALMNSAMELLGQIDPEAGGFGRTLYAVTIDRHENGRLVAQAEEEGMAPAENAALAVNYRTWARVFFRDEVMVDQNCAEILFMRDLGVSGRQAGETPDTIKQKVFAKRQKEAKLDVNAPFEKASEEEKLAVYKGMIESAKKTNPNVNGSLKVTEPAPKTQGGLETPKT